MYQVSTAIVINIAILTRMIFCLQNKDYKTQAMLAKPCKPPWKNQNTTVIREMGEAGGGRENLGALPFREKL